MSPTLKVATRGSLLALVQARWVMARLEAAHPGLQCEIVTFKTTGDRVQNVALSRIGTRGLFTRELEEALLDGRADLAVHSLKDVPTARPDTLILAAVPERADARDALVTRDGRGLSDLPPGAAVGTSSLRRISQLRRCRPDLAFVEMRGNVDTRLRKLHEGQCDALVLAAAGLERGGHAERISERLHPAVCLPAPGQGALAIEVPAAATATRALVAALHHPPTATAVAAERAFLAAVEGGCQVPAAALATLDGDELHLEGLVAAVDGTALVRHSRRGPAADPEAIGRDLAAAVLAAGGAAILNEVRRHQE